MPCWYFDKSDLKDTASLRDGIDSETEARYRREGARFIMECGNSLKLRYDTMATGVVFYHRFYMFHSFNEFPRYVMATCCLFLAGKVEETPKKCKDLVKAAKQWLESKNLKKHSDTFGDDPSKDIMIYERILLQTIKFDLQVDHPYGYLLKYAKTLKGNQEQIRTMVQMAWTFINDSYSTTLCLQWEPEIIAIALMYLTSKLSKLEITDWVAKKENTTNGTQQNWWDQFVESLRIDILEDVCHQILDLYATQQLEQQQKTKTINNTPNLSTTPVKTNPNQMNSTPILNNKRNSPPPITQQPINDTTSPSNPAKMLRTNHNEAYPMYNNQPAALNPNQIPNNSYSYAHNSNIYANEAFHSKNLQYNQTASAQLPPQHIYHQSLGHNQQIYPGGMIQPNLHYYYPATNATAAPPPPPQPNLPPPPPYSNMYHQANPYDIAQFNSNINNPYSMYQSNPNYLNNNDNLSQYSNGVKESNNNKHYSSANSNPTNATQMRSSNLKTVNITDRPI